MIALEVHVNGKKQCVAGIGNDGVVSAIVTWVGRGDDNAQLPKEELNFRVGGLDSRKGQHMDWLFRDLQTGDEITVRVINTKKADAPLKGSRRPVDNGRRRQKAYVRRMAKQFGWKIQTK